MREQERALAVEGPDPPRFGFRLRSIESAIAAVPLTTGIDVLVDPDEGV